MTEEPYRWLEAIENRREYVREQLKGGSPGFAVRLPDGILLLGVGGGNSKVFELFDRQALVALGHPADIEKIRQAAIDAAHMEAFTRAPEDVTLRRLVGFGLSPQLKTNFEQIFSAPFLIEVLLAEVNREPEHDLLLRLHFDGSFQFQTTRAVVLSTQAEAEIAAQKWLNDNLPPDVPRKNAVDLLLQTWWLLSENKNFEAAPAAEERQKGWRDSLRDKIVEIGWLARESSGPARYLPLTLTELGL